jgi:hypothetical protein
MTNDQLRTRAQAFITPLLELHQRHRWPVGPLASVLLSEGVTTRVIASGCTNQRASLFVKSARARLTLVLKSGSYHRSHRA